MQYIINYFQYIMKYLPHNISGYPRRSPLAVANRIEKYIVGKHVCEIGSHKGAISLALSQYASKVTGIEIHKCLVYEASKIVDNAPGGLYENTSFEYCDITTDSIPAADIYYVWITPKLFNLLLRRLLDEKPDFKGKIIFAFTKMGVTNPVQYLKTMGAYNRFGGEVITFDINSPSFYVFNGQTYRDKMIKTYSMSKSPHSKYNLWIIDRDEYMKNKLTVNHPYENEWQHLCSTYKSLT